MDNEAFDNIQPHLEKIQEEVRMAQNNTSTIVRNLYFYQMTYIFIFFSVFLEIQILLSGLLYCSFLWPLIILWQYEFIVI